MATHPAELVDNAILAAGKREGPATLVSSSIECDVLELFDQYYHPLLRYVLSLGMAVQDGEEIAQEVFLLLCRHLRLGRPRDNLRGWIFRVGHNLALKRRAAQRRFDTAGSESLYLALRPDPAPDPEQRTAAAERHRHLLAVVRALAPQDQRCLALRAEGLRYREIARVLGISVGSVANSLARSLERLGDPVPKPVERSSC